jgi:SAM-dependent methyltransferase
MGLLASRLGIAVYLLCPHRWVWTWLTPEERAVVEAGDRYQNTQRPDYADPTQYQGGVGFDSLTDARRERHLQQLVEFLDRVRPASVLEVGPGSGYLTRTIVEHAAVRRYVAVDVNPAFLEYLRPRLEGVQKEEFTFELFAGTVDQVRASGFDAAVLLSVVHHIPDRERLFSTIGALLNRPGHVLAIDPTHYLLRIRKLLRKVARRGYLDMLLALARQRQISTHAMCQLAEYRAVTRRTGFEITLVHFDNHPRRVRQWRARGIPLGPFWRWTAQEMTIECVRR